MEEAVEWDLLIIGGGIGGVIALKYALEVGLRVLLLEKEAGVGGLWRQLPAWQEIQTNRKEWTLGDLPIEGEDQASILRNIEAWVERFGLAPHLRLDSPVEKASPNGGGWRVESASGTYRARALLCATGGHNRPFLPALDRADATALEFHSSQLRDPELLCGRAVVVVGGGTSAWDLLEECFEHGAAHVTWVYRSLKWMRPSLATKSAGSGSGMRRLAQAQMLRLPTSLLSRLLDRRLRGAYRRLRLEALIPERPFDLTRDQTPPGRRLMLQNLDKIDRHRGEIARLEGSEACLTDGSRVKADIVLWGTGYEVDLGYLDVPLARLTRLEDLVARCGALFKAVAAPNLFLLAPGILDTNVSAPWAYAHAAKSIVSHLREGQVFDGRVARRRPVYFGLVRFLAARDRRSYPWLRWNVAYLRLAFLAKGTLPLP